ncbi:MAG: DUF3347 domain-containing protein [Bacteroidetes bacterium]|jgi:hypothetical protein|nr:DUF3347 domain-containing protein [Bacteroidota bacterium]
MRVYFIAVCFSVGILAACGSAEEENVQREEHQQEIQKQPTSNLPYNFRLEMDSVLTRYFALKKAFIESDSEQTVKKAEELSRFSKSVMDEVLEAKKRGLWLAIDRIIQKESENLISEPDVDEQRVYFRRISNAMIRMVEEFNPVEYTIYHMSCPDFRGRTAEWLSREEDIRNPYHGEETPDCGEIVQRL